MRGLSRWLPVLLVASAGCVDKDIVRHAPARVLAPEEIVAGLASPEFRVVLAARAQLQALPDGDWLTTLQRLSRDPSPGRRMLAAIELSKRPVPRAREVLASLADDPDEAVRAEARARLAAAPPAGGVP